METSGRKISFLVTEKELKLLEEACLYGGDEGRNLEAAVPEKDQYRLSFSYEELDDFVGFVAASANQVTSIRKREQLDKLCGKIESFLKLSDSLSGKRLEDLVKAKSNQGRAQPKRPALKYFIFNVWISGSGGADDFKSNILRKIQIPGTKSLYSFARTITQAFEFYFDHCFGFYDNFERTHDSKKAYELFTDIGEDPTPGAKSVKSTKIAQAFKNPGDKMLFLFDYGDGWRFAVKLKEIRQSENQGSKPVILEKTGKAPLQYPPCKD